MRTLSQPRTRYVCEEGGRKRVAVMGYIFRKLFTLFAHQRANSLRKIIFYCVIHIIFVYFNYHRNFLICVN